MSRLKAAFLSPCLGVGGGDGFMLSLTRHARNIEFTGICTTLDVSLQSFTRAKSVMASGIPVHAIRGELRHGWEFGGIHLHDNFADAARAACVGADIIIAWHTMRLNDVGSYFKEAEIPIIGIAQNEDSSAQEVIRTCMYNWLDYYVAVSEAAVKAYPPACHSDVAVIYNGIEADRCTPREGRDAIRHRWNLADKKVLLFMGRHAAEKNSAAPIAALQHLPDDWVVLFVGKGSLESSVRNQAARYAPSRCFFVESLSHVGDVLAAADVFVLPSDFEGMPLAVAEAWLAGVPCVTSELNVMKELETKFNCKLVTQTPFRPTGEVLAKAVLEAHADQETVIRARNICWENFTISRIAIQWEDFLHYCMDDWRGHLVRPKVWNITGQSKLSDD